MKISTKLQDVVKSLTTKMIDQDTREWPPHCLLFSYQPMRPTQDADNKLVPNHSVDSED